MSVFRSQACSTLIVLVSAAVTFTALRHGGDVTVTPPPAAPQLTPIPLASSGGGAPRDRLVVSTVNPEPASQRPAPPPTSSRSSSGQGQEWRWRGHQCTNLDLFPAVPSPGCVPLSPRLLPHCHFDAGLEVISVPRADVADVGTALNSSGVAPEPIMRRCALWATVNFTTARDAAAATARRPSIVNASAFTGVVDPEAVPLPRLSLDPLHHTLRLLNNDSQPQHATPPPLLNEGLLAEDTETVLQVLRAASHNGRRAIVFSGDSVTRQLFSRLVLILRGSRRASVDRVADEAMFVTPFVSTHNDWVYVLRRHNDEMGTTRNRDHFAPRGVRRKANKKTVVTYVPDVADARPGHPRCNADGQCVISPFDTVKSVWCDPFDADNPCLVKLIFVWEGFEHTMRFADDLAEVLSIATRTSASLTTTAAAAASTAKCDTTRLVSNMPTFHLHGQHYWSVLGIHPPPYIPVPTRRRPASSVAGAGIDAPNVTNDTAVVEFALSQLVSWPSLVADAFPFSAVSTGGQEDKRDASTSDDVGAACKEVLLRDYRLLVLTTPPIRSQRKLFGITPSEKRILRERIDVRNRALRRGLAQDSLLDWDGVARTVPVDARPHGADEVHWLCSRVQEKLVEEGPGECRGGRDRAALAMFLHVLWTSPSPQR